VTGAGSLNGIGWAIASGRRGGRHDRLSDIAADKLQIAADALGLLIKVLFAT
jgi:hypothetical protein